MHPKLAKPFVVFMALGTPFAAGCGRKAEPAEVTIALREPQAAIASATILVDYSQAGAKPLRSGGELSCATIVPNVTADFSDDGQGRITIHARAPQGLSTPVDLAVCRMIPQTQDATAATIASKLRISVLDGTDMAGAPIGAAKVARGESRREQREETIKPHDREAREEERLAARQATGEEGGAGTATEQAPAVAPGAGQPAGAGKTAAAPPHASAPAPAAKARPNSLIAGSEPGAEPRDSGAAGTEGQSGSQGRGSEGVGGGSADANDEADTDRAARSYEIVVGVTNDTGKLGALQFDILHSGSSGGFAGAAGSARCSTQVPAALATFNDKGHGTLSGALIDIDGIPTPGAVASCTFRSRDAVTAADFSVRVVDAASIDGGKPTSNPQMGIVSMRALD